MREIDRKHIEKTGLKEFAWFVGLWALGVTAVLVLGLLIKLFI
jgi:hypothetical protein